MLAHSTSLEPTVRQLVRYTTELVKGGMSLSKATKLVADTYYISAETLKALENKLSASLKGGKQ